MNVEHLRLLSNLHFNLLRKKWFRSKKLIKKLILMLIKLIDLKVYFFVVTSFLITLTEILFFYSFSIPKKFYKYQQRHLGLNPCSLHQWYIIYPFYKSYRSNTSVDCWLLEWLITSITFLIEISFEFKFIDKYRNFNRF